MTRFLTPFCFALTIIAPVSGMACPVASDLEDGIRIIGTEGDSEVFKRLDNHVVTGLYTDVDGYVSRTYLAKGLYLLEYIELENGQLKNDSREVVAFPLTPEKLPEITPGTRWSVAVAVRSSSGLDAETQTYQMGQTAPIRIGGCRYDAIPVTITYAPDPLQTEETLTYLPALGIGYLTQYGDTEGTDDYKYSRIEAVAAQ